MNKLDKNLIKRVCTKCDIEKPIINFYWDKRFDIPFARCKECYNQRVKTYRHSKEGKQSYKKWVQSDKGKMVRENAIQKWRLLNVSKRAAHTKVSNALRDGRLKRLPCEICGNPVSEAHHASYKPENWLKVIWLCKKHHTSITFSH